MDEQGLDSEFMLLVNRTIHSERLFVVCVIAKSEVESFLGISFTLTFGGQFVLTRKGRDLPWCYIFFNITEMGSTHDVKLLKS